MGQDLSRFIKDNPELADCLEHLVAPRDVTSDVANAFKLLLGTVVGEPKPLSVADVATGLCAIEDAPIIDAGQVCLLDADIRAILAALPDLTVSLRGSRLFYRFGDIKGMARWLHGSDRHGHFDEWLRRE